MSDAYPDWLEQNERKLIAERRAKARALTESEAAKTLEQALIEHDDRVGLALSGGGIRSATFALGVLQGLACCKRLSHVDLLSTVSGGGYTGSFWGAQFIPQALRDIPEGERAQQLERDAADPKHAPNAASITAALAQAPGAEAFAVWWLRQNGRYLAPKRGSSLVMVAILLRNWLSVLLSLLVPAVGVFLLGVTPRLLPLHVLQDAHVRYAVWWSPWIGVPLACLAAALPIGCAYWMVPSRLPGMRLSSTAIAGCTILIVLALALLRTYTSSPHLLESCPSWSPTLGVLLAIAALLALAVAASRGSGGDVDPVRARYRLTVALRSLLALCFATFAFALIDSLGQTLYALAVHEVRWVGKWALSVLSPIAAVTAVGPRVLTFFSAARTSPKLSLSLNTVALVLGVLVAAIVLVLAATLAHAFAWHGLVPPTDPGAKIGASWLPAGHALAPGGVPALGLDAVWLLAGVMAFAIVSWLLSMVRPFLNQSSLSAFYASRLTRTFVGASNQRRRAAQTEQGSAEAQGNLSRHLDPTEPVPGDDVEIDKYIPHVYGGPLHIINVTLNETIDDRSATDEQDRKGLQFALGPLALSVGVTRHGERCQSASNRGAVLCVKAPDNTARDAKPADSSFELFPPQGAGAEALSLGRWIGVSGAAVAPGLGANSSLGAGLLTVLFNLRLGHWWYSGTKPAGRPGKIESKKTFARIGRGIARNFPVLSHLLDELTVRFHGTARENWYLSDGGHFENTGCYELVRRGVPLIICSDAGADPEYRFEDVGNLVRKARLDFGAELRFFDEAELSALLHAELRRYFGTLEELKRIRFRDPARADGRTPHAALAGIRYSNGRSGLLILIKPTLCGSEPFDVRQYADQKREFPQESTADQFFDEAQWESYRRLGEHIANALFATPADVAPDKPPRAFWPGVIGAGLSDAQKQDCFKTALDKAQKNLES